MDVVVNAVSLRQEVPIRNQKSSEFFALFVPANDNSQVKRLNEGEFLALRVKLEMILPFVGFSAFSCKRRDARKNSRASDFVQFEIQGDVVFSYPMASGKQKSWPLSDKALSNKYVDIIFI